MRLSDELRAEIDPTRPGGPRVLDVHPGADRPSDLDGCPWRVGGSGGVGRDDHAVE